MRFLFALYFILHLALLNAQITGKVSNQADEPLAFAAVSLLHTSDSSLLMGIFTDEQGQFSLKPESMGTYFLRIEASGFRSWSSSSFEFTAAQNAWNLGSISLEEKTLTLDEVQIQGRQSIIQHAPEGSIINVEASLMNRGGNALQVLERSPGVFVDRENNQLMLNGQNGVMIMINGRLMRMSANQVLNLLQSMSADNIETIELLTSPSAQYGAEGSAGIINLVLKKNTVQGINGSASLTAGYGWREKAAASLNLNYRKASFSAFVNYAYNRDGTFSNFRGIGRQFVPVLGGEMQFDFSNETERLLNSHNLNFGVEREFKSGWLVGSQLTYLQSQNIASINNDANYFLYPDSFFNAKIHIDAPNLWTNLNGGIYAEKSWQDQSKLLLQLDYLGFSNDNPSYAQSQYFLEDGLSFHPSDSIFAEAHRGISATKISLGVFKADYQRSLNDKLDWQIGLKGSATQSQNSSGIERFVENVWQKDWRAAADMNMRELIGGLYTSFDYRLSDRTQLSAGLRYEYWDRQSLEAQIDRSFGRFFPSFFFTHKLQKNGEWQLAYTRRITRPDFNDLAANQTYNGPISVFSGNPNLNPNTVDRLKLAYVIKGYQFSLSLQQQDNPIVRYQISSNPNGDLVFVMPHNIAYQQSLNLQLDAPLQLNNWWSANLGAIGSWRQYQLSHTVEAFEDDYLTFNLYGNTSIDFPRAYSLELSGWYTGPFYEGSKEFEGFGMLNLGLQKRFKNSSIQLTVSDLFKSMNIVSYFGTTTQEAFDAETRVLYQAESSTRRIIKLSYQYNFGNRDLKSRSGQKGAATEERARLVPN
ncbi:MAG: TonB-dependent receptor [Bacteroidota bacterium]